MNFKVMLTRDFDVKFLAKSGFVLKVKFNVGSTNQESHKIKPGKKKIVSLLMGRPKRKVINFP